METQNNSPTRWWTLTAVAIAGALQSLDITIVQVAIPQLRHAFDASLADLQWVIDAYTLTLATFLIVSGSVADRYGRRRTMLAGLALFSAASLGCALAADIGPLNIARGIQGIAGSMLFAIGPALIAAEFQGKERGVALGVFGGSAGLATALGPLVGGALLSGPGWRWIFFINIPLALVSMVMLLAKTKESRDLAARPADWPGTATFFVATGALVLALLEGGTKGWTNPVILAAFLVAAVGLVLFAVIERARGDNAMFDLKMFGNRSFTGISALAFVGNAASYPAIFFVVSYLQNILGYSPLDAGLRIMLWTAMLLLGAMVAGSLSSRFAPGGFLGVSMVLMGTGFAFVLLTGTDSSWLVLVPLMVVGGIGMGFWTPPRLAVAMGVVSPDKAGLASGINETFQQVGLCVGIAGVGAFFQNRVAGSLDTAGAQVAGRTSSQVAKAVAAGDMSGGGAAGQQFLDTARSAFVDAMHSAMLMTVVLAFLAAVIAFTLIRVRDMYTSNDSHGETGREEVAACAQS